MQVSEKLVELLHNFNIPNLNSNFLMSDLYQILYTTTNKLDDYYWHKPLSEDIKDLAVKWSYEDFSEDLFLVLNDNLKQIIQNDSTNYSAQMIFPIYINKKLDGFVFFFRTSGDYIASSSKAPKTVRNFIQKHLNDEKREVLILENEKVDFSSYFENDLFSQEEVDLIEEKMENNMPILLGRDNYIDIDNKISEANVKLTKLLNEKELKIFKDYQSASINATSYQNCLAYYLGVQAGINSNKLK